MTPPVPVPREKWEEVILYEISLLRNGTKFTSKDVRDFARIDGYDLSEARRQGITRIIDRHFRRVPKARPHDWTVWIKEGQ